jgi:hypothetical protein
MTFIIQPKVSSFAQYFDSYLTEIKLMLHWWMNRWTLSIFGSQGQRPRPELGIATVTYFLYFEYLLFGLHQTLYSICLGFEICSPLNSNSIYIYLSYLIVWVNRKVYIASVSYSIHKIKTISHNNTCLHFEHI